MNPVTLNSLTQTPRFEGNRAVIDSAIWLRLPRPGTRCPLTGLSRSSLAELVRPCLRNGFKAPVAARVLKRRDARRGILIINRESLIGYLNDLPAPSASAPGEEGVQ